LAKYLQQCNATHKIMNIVMGLWAWRDAILIDIVVFEGVICTWIRRSQQVCGLQHWMNSFWVLVHEQPGNGTLGQNPRQWPCIFPKMSKEETR
jgi:hypothetical protein